MRRAAGSADSIGAHPGSGDYDLAAATERLCRQLTGDGSASVRDFHPLDGHAGLTYGFICATRAGSEALVLRLPPAGVRHEGPADVLRQARLLRGLVGTPVPVPKVRWSGDDPRWFGRPFLITARVAGRTLPVFSPGAGSGPAGSWRALGEQAATTLAELHGLDWERILPNLGRPAPLTEEVSRWDRFLERTADPELTELAPTLRQALIEAAPSSWRTVLAHGDFQWTNLLFRDSRLVAVLDWELAGLGPSFADIGWLMTFTDQAAWEPGLLNVRDLPSPQELKEFYLRHTGEEAGQLPYGRALAAYKFAVISGFNLRLHRTRRRPDPFWERLAPSIPFLLRRGLQLLVPI